MLYRCLYLIVLAIMLVGCDRVDFEDVGPEEVKPPVTEEPIPDESTFNVLHMPEQLSMWNGHLVMCVSGNDALLLSLKDWEKMTSGLNQKNPTIVHEIAESYAESGIEGWSIPTKSQATMIRDVCTEENIEIINNLLKDNAGDEIYVKKPTSGNYRYLCDDALLTFAFVKGSSISNAGATVTDYRLRLVKAVRFKIND